MPRISRNFPTAQPSGSQHYTVDFTGYLPAGSNLASAVWDLSVDRTLSGFAPDSSPNARKIGAPAIDGSTSTQEIGGTVAGNDYVVTVTGATDAGDEVVLWTILPSRSAGSAGVTVDDRVRRLASIERARDSGVLTVRHGDTQTTFRTLAEMDEIIYRLRREIYGINQTKRLRILTTKGL
jgi:hypothetical protein